MQRLSSPALMCMLSCFSRVRLFATPWLRVHELLQARILEWVPMPSSRGSSPPRDWTSVSYISCIGRWVLYCCLGSPLPSIPHLKMVKVECWTAIQKVIREIPFAVWSELWYHECNIWIFFLGGGGMQFILHNLSSLTQGLNPVHSSESAES